MKNNKIAILVDSGTDVPEELIKKYEMYMIPLKIIYKDQVYTDKIDITSEEIYQRLPEEIPGTSLPDGESITEIFEQIKKDGYEKVLAVTISSGLSGTYNVVRLIAQQQEELEACICTRYEKYWYWCRFFCDPSSKMAGRRSRMGSTDQ